MKSKLLKDIVSIFPPLTGKNSKGDCGRICVIGGSYQFSGAPYYSAISALKVGGDLGHIFTNKNSSTAIKSYSPQIIVHPYFVSKQEVCLKETDQEDAPQLWMKGIIGWSKAINCWVVGPGLGRDPYIAQFFPQLVRNLPSQHVVIFNADAIYHLTKDPQLFQELPRFKKSVLLTNSREWDIFKKYFKIDFSFQDLQNYETKEQITEITDCFSFDKFTLVLKGKRDIIIGKRSFICDIEGGRKRCAGIGDIFAGITSVCTYWNKDLGPILASKITKQATRNAYQKHGRSLVAKNIIAQLPRTVMQLQSKYL